MYELITDEDFITAIQNGFSVSFLSLDFIGSGPANGFTKETVNIGDNILLRSEFKFFIEEANAILH